MDPLWLGRRSRPLHRWDLAPREAIELQRRLASQVIVGPPPGPIRTVAGLDMAVFREQHRCVAGAVLLDLESLAVLATARIELPVRFPYVPGLLSFREAPGLLAALARLPAPADCLVLDAHGLAHPRRFGLAAHVGLWGDLPALGVAKSLLVGEHGPLGLERGARALLRDRGDVVGVALRTRTGVKPVYVSVGHRFDLESAGALVLRLAPRWRLTEPIRLAHRLVNSPAP